MAPPRLDAGTQFRERYRLEKPLGRGGMGEVWLALDARLRRPVAIKVLRSDVTQDPSCADRFRREALATARVTHPNLVAVFDMELDHEPPFIAMEFLDGPTVARELKKGPFTEARALAVAEQSLRALAALHAVGIVHRDIKPGNIMLVSSSGVETTKVVDLGIAQLMTGTVYQRLTSTGAIVGTPAYMAPEMLEGGHAAPACDVWATGLVLFALLTGRKPFADADLAELVQSVLDPAPAPDVRTFAPATSPQTAIFVRALLEKSPLRRPASAAEALQLLEHLHGPPQRHSLEPQRHSLEPQRHSLEPSLLSPRHSMASLPPSLPTPAPPNAVAPALRPWMFALLAGGVLSVLMMAMGGVALWVYTSRARPVALAPPPTPALQTAAPEAAQTAAPEAAQTATPAAAQTATAPPPPNSASTRTPHRVAERPRARASATNGYTAEPAGFAAQAPVATNPQLAPEMDRAFAQPDRTTSIQVRVQLVEPALSLRNSFEAHARSISSRCRVAPRPSGTEFARFTVVRGQVSRVPGYGTAFPSELSCVVSVLSDVDWDGGAYHVNAQYGAR